MIHYNDNLNINPTGTDDFLTSVHKNLCFIELRLRLLAAWATPVVGQVFKCHTIVFGRVVQIATHRADIFAGIFLLGEIYLCQYGWYGIVQIHHALGLQVLIALWCVGATIDGGVVADKLCITTTYLSRVVRQVSDGRTVVDYINQMLLMEATFLLRQTSLSITQISDQLHISPKSPPLLASSTA